MVRVVVGKVDMGMGVDYDSELASGIDYFDKFDD
jgi:hypothetical protein